MSHTYQPILWSKRKKRYDWVMLGLILLYLIVFIGLQLAFYPEITAETMLIRATGTLAFLMLHIILIIGPLCRLSPRFLPLLYNRRHIGVSLFIIALIHGILNLMMSHALGDTNPILSIFTSNPNYNAVGDFPFQVLGFFALLILFVMAATSHDFWLKNLSPKIWKGLHMGVYTAYILILLHVFLGTFQREGSMQMLGLMTLGAIIVAGLHLKAAYTNVNEKIDTKKTALEGFYEVCSVSEIEEDRAKVVLLAGENIAVFKYDNKLSAVHNGCKHQNGPLGEGKIVDGCITCPWHGYQYEPQNGCAPAPFTEKIKTYEVKVVDGVVYVNPNVDAEGVYREPASI